MSPENIFKYDNGFIPPAPVLNIEVRIPTVHEQSMMVKIVGQLDTGADGTAIPVGLIEKLGLCQVDEIQVGGYDDDEDSMKISPVYSAHITIEPLKPFIAEVIPEYKEKEYALIGRDIINKMLITLDGPRDQMYVSK